MNTFFYGNNPHSNKHRPTPTLRPINISKEQLRDFRNLLSEPRTSQKIKKRFMVQKAGGYCCMCGDMATQIASYDMNGAILVEKYCGRCLARRIT
jgi:hypothetical protein